MSVFSAVSVLDRDPDLGEDLRPEEFGVARQQAVARVLRYAKGPCAVRASDFNRAGALGLLITDGLLVRNVTVGERTCAELLGPGDVTQPWLRTGSDSSVGTEVNWQVARHSPLHSSTAASWAASPAGRRFRRPWRATRRRSSVNSTTMPPDARARY